MKKLVVHAAVQLAFIAILAGCVVWIALLGPPAALWRWWSGTWPPWFRIEAESHALELHPDHQTGKTSEGER